jgi:DNA processing protein
MTAATVSAGRLARVALCRLGEPGDPRLTSLVADLGAVAVYEFLLDERGPTGVATDVAARLRGLDPAGDLARAHRLGIRFVCPEDDEWPAGLADLDRAEAVHRRSGSPLGLWVRGTGRLDELCARAVAVVGSRSATTYGTGVAAEIAAGLAEEHVTVVSGAAFGIDGAAHRGALAARGPTVAVLACGVDRAYPLAHRALLSYIADTGLVISELPPGCAPTKLRFLARNRVIAALSLGTVVVEAAVRSGALNTANWAGGCGRVVMGVPGPVTSAPSEGVHELIRQRDAVLVTRAADVLEVISPAGTHVQPWRRAPERAWDRLSEVDQQVLDAVPAQAAAPISSIARTAGLVDATVRTSLTRLGQVGLVESGPRGWRLAPRGGAP